MTTFRNWSYTDPSDYFRNGSGIDLSEHQRLWWAVLRLALQDATETAKGRTRSRRVALEWLRNPEAAYVGSFLWVCDALGLSAESILVRLQLRDPLMPWRTRFAVYAGTKGMRVLPGIGGQRPVKVIRAKRRQ